ncbi:MAG: mucoidy inhibitor MuiA family protein [Methanimicrococcus sp.]|nr:mucoidy inhibitor MuiA family protein [Methanimicrococcus sp.]
MDKIQSQIKDTVIYFRGAELTHSAKARLTKGSNEIQVGGLSPHIDHNTLKIKTTNSVVVSSFEFSVDYLTENALSVEAQKLKDEIKEKQKELSRLYTQIGIHENMLSFLQNSIDKKVFKKSGVFVDELMQTMDYYKSKTCELEDVLFADREKADKMNEMIRDLSAQFDQKSLKNNKTSGLLRLTLSSPADIECDLEIIYFTNNAGWYPYHDIVVEAADKPVQITSKAKVRQVTGIDWDKVKVTLSTAAPSAGKVAPLFSAWFLRYAEPAAEYAYSARSLRKSQAMPIAQNTYSYADARVQECAAVYPEEAADFLPAEPAAPLYIVDGVVTNASHYASLDPSMIKNVEYVDASSAVYTYGPEASGGVYIVAMKSGMEDFIKQSENQMNISFEIELLYSIPGNGKEQSIELKKQEVPVEFKYYCAPQMDHETYLLAEIADWEKLNLLSGNANVTYDGTFVGATYLNAESAQKILSLTLGTDRRVTVKREKMKEYSSSNFLGNDVKQEFAYRMTVKNNQNRKIKMVLKDRYPISTYKEVTVELSKETTAPSFNVEDIGVLAWEFEMQPGDSKVFKTVYTVKYPKGKELNL